MEMKASHEVTGQIEERDGKKVVNLPMPASFQGHTFALDMEREGDDHIPSGRFRIEFVLSDSFSSEQRSPSLLEWQEGFCSLSLSDEAALISQVHCTYGRKSIPDQSSEALLRFQCRDGDRKLQRILIIIEEDTTDMALEFAGVLANQLLDILTFRKGVPLEVRRIDIVDDANDTPVRSYIQIPYTIAREIVPDDIEAFAAIPDRLKAVLRMLREATNSSNPFYRCLCLYRIFEGLQKVRTSNNKIAKGTGHNLRRAKIRVEDNELTRSAFPNFVGASLNAFLEHVKDTCRLDIAHFNINELENLLLDPAVVGNVHRVDQVNAVLLLLARQSIQSERKFMLEAGIVPKNLKPQKTSSTSA